MQNYKKYAIPRAQLVIADVPYNVGNNFYGSNPMWYTGGDNKNGESKLAGKAAFNSDFNFNLYEYFHFCSKMLRKEPKKAGARGRSSDAPCMIVFCSFEQIQTLINAAAKHGFVHYIPLVFIKNYSPQVLKANMRVVGATEYALVFYRNKLPKFRNGAQTDENGKTIRGTGKMVFNWFQWEKDGKDIPKIHPAQKPVAVLKRLIEIFTDPGDVVIDPCCGSGSTLRAAEYGSLLSGAALSACPKNTVIADMVIENILHRKSYRKISKERYIPMNPKDFYGYRRKTVAVLYERMRLLGVWEGDE